MIPSPLFAITGTKTVIFDIPYRNTVHVLIIDLSDLLALLYIMCISLSSYLYRSYVPKTCTNGNNHKVGSKVFVAQFGSFSIFFKNFKGFES